MIYLDSAPFAEGTGLLDVMPEETVNQLRKLAAEDGDGWQLPLPPFDVVAAFSSLDGLDEERRELMRTRSTPQPFRTFEQRLTGADEPGPDVDRVVVACNDAKALLDAGVAGAGLPQPVAVAALPSAHGALAHAVHAAGTRRHPRRGRVFRTLTGR